MNYLTNIQFSIMMSRPRQVLAFILVLISTSSLGATFNDGGETGSAYMDLDGGPQSLVIDASSVDSGAAAYHAGDGTVGVDCMSLETPVLLLDSGSTSVVSIRSRLDLEISGGTAVDWATVEIATEAGDYVNWTNVPFASWHGTPIHATWAQTCMGSKPNPAIGRDGEGSYSNMGAPVSLSGYEGVRIKIRILFSQDTVGPSQMWIDNISITNVVADLSLSGLLSPLRTGEATTFTVRSLDANGQPFLGTVDLTSTDPAMSSNPNPYTFIGGDAGEKVFNVTFNTEGAHTVTVEDQGSSESVSDSTVVYTSSDSAVFGGEVGQGTMALLGWQESLGYGFDPINAEIGESLSTLHKGYYWVGFHYQDVAIDSAGNVMAVTAADPGVADADAIATYYDSNTQTWGTSVVLDTNVTFSSFTNNVIVDGVGNFYSFHTSWDGAAGQDYIKKWDAGTKSWGPEEVGESQAGNSWGFHRSVVLPNNDIATIGSIDNGIVQSIVFARRDFVTDVVTDFMVPAQTTNAAYHEMIAADINGNIMLTWIQYTGAGTAYNVYARYYDEGLGAWQSETVIGGDNTNHARYPKVAASENGDFMVVWHQLDAGGGADIWANRFDSASGWPGGWDGATMIENIEGGTEKNAQYPKVVMSSGGDAIVTYYEVETTGPISSSLYAVHYDAGLDSWAAPVLLENMSGAIRVNLESETLVLNPTNDGAVSVFERYDGTRYSAYYVKYVAGEGWSAPKLLEKGSNDTTYPRLAVNEFGQFVASWIQVEDGGTWRRLWVSIMNPIQVYSGQQSFVAGKSVAQEECSIMETPIMALSDTNVAEISFNGLLDLETAGANNNDYLAVQISTEAGGYTDWTTGPFAADHTVAQNTTAGCDNLEGFTANVIGGPTREGNINFSTSKETFGPYSLSGYEGMKVKVRFLFSQNGTNGSSVAVDDLVLTNLKTQGLSSSATGMDGPLGIACGSLAVINFMNGRNGGPPPPPSLPIGLSLIGLVALYRGARRLKLAGAADQIKI